MSRVPIPSPQTTHTMAAVEELKNFINGEFVACSKHLDSYNPATGEVHLRIPDSGKEEVDAAVKAAKEAFKKSVSRSSPAKLAVTVLSGSNEFMFVLNQVVQDHCKGTLQSDDEDCRYRGVSYRRVCSGRVARSGQTGLAGQGC